VTISELGRHTTTTDTSITTKPEIISVQVFESGDTHLIDDRPVYTTGGFRCDINNLPDTQVMYNIIITPFNFDGYSDPV
jgi:hypothetical protein